MERNNRNQKIAALEALPAERKAARPSKPEHFNPTLPCDLAEALAYRRKHLDLIQAAEMGLAQLEQFDYATREMTATFRREIQADPILAAAKLRLQKEIEFRETLGTEQKFLGQFPGSEGITSSRNRTAADEAATDRARQALTKLERLAFVPGDLPKMIAGIWKELHEADLAAMWEQPAPAPKPAAPSRPSRDKLVAVGNYEDVTLE